MAETRSWGGHTGNHGHHFGSAIVNLRDLEPDDVPRLVELNNAAVPAVPTTAHGEMAALLALSDFGFAAVDDTDDATLAGFILGFRPGARYTSENYRFFEARGVDSLYVDRIVVTEAARRQRVGRSLYDRVLELASVEGRAEVTCEVNLDPPNPGSVAFHERLGFHEVGQQATKNGTVTVLLLAVAVGA